MLKAYIEMNLASGFMQRFSSFATASILFANVKNRSLRLCGEYQAVKPTTAENRYPLPLISEVPGRIRRTNTFTTLDLRGARKVV